MNFSKLDKNCVSQIFFFLDLYSIGCLSRVNKRLNEIGCSDLLWKKKYEIYFGDLSSNQSQQKRFSYFFNKNRALKRNNKLIFQILKKKTKKKTKKLERNFQRKL